MNFKRWIARREPNWKTLEQLLKQAENKGFKSLKPDQIQTLASLYRSASADLARAQTHRVSETLTGSLQALTSRGYSLIYQSSRKQEWRSLLTFYRQGFPEVVRQTWVYTAIATALFVVSGLFAWWYSNHDPEFMAMIVPEHLIHKVQHDGELWMGAILGSEPAAASDIMTNNIGVCFKVMAGGISAGFFTCLLLVFNGLLIGGVAALVGQNGLAGPFWGFVLPHGSLELPAIFLSGGAGLLLARAILFPGQYKRIDALKIYGQQAAQIVYGIVPMLIIAGVIEGFLSPSPLFPDVIKYAIGTFIFILFMTYLQNRSPNV
jgi:uncharacterized membrane protein SpoIIM required for sporulation